MRNPMMKNPMMKNPIGLGLVFCLVLAVSAVLGTSAYAVPVSFTDDFGDGVLNPLLEDESGTAFTESGGVIFNTSGSRNYIRTVDADFNNTAGFVFGLDINLSSPAEIGFIGFGPGSPDGGLFDEPFGAFFRIHTSDLASGFLDFATNTVAGGGWESNNTLALPGPGDGTHRSQITFDGNDTLTFDYDADFDGTFVSNYNATVTLSSLGFNNTNSRLFFGTTNSITSFDNLSVNVVNAVPEPGTVVLLSTGLVGLLGYYGWRRRKHAA